MRHVLTGTLLLAGLVAGIIGLVIGNTDRSYGTVGNVGFLYAYDVPCGSAFSPTSSSEKCSAALAPYGSTATTLLIVAAVLLVGAAITFTLAARRAPVTATPS